MRVLLFLVFSLICQVSMGKATNYRALEDSIDVELQVGDSMEIGACPSQFFTHLDLFRKTRWEGGEDAYDTATGNGFYKSFFSSGDFNATELPAEYSNKHFVVMGMEVLSNKKTGEPMYIMYLKGSEPNSVIWVDFYEALGAGEIKVLPRS